jgi:hypothetical protein
LDSEIVGLAKDEDFEVILTEADDYQYQSSVTETLTVIIKYHERANTKVFTGILTTHGTSPPAPTSKVPHRLPKLTLSRFDGNVLDWPTFNDDFSSAVHDQLNLTKIEKFQYLRSQLDGEARSTIKGLSLTAENYDNAWKMLKERFRQLHRVTNAFMKALWDLPYPSEDITSLRSFHDKLETLIRGSQSLN